MGRGYKRGRGGQRGGRREEEYSAQTEEETLKGRKVKGSYG